ncbi:MAG: hypothetical protein ABW072_08600 [Sedimenticola sp.]
MRQSSEDNVIARFEYLVEGNKNPDSIPMAHIDYLSGQRVFAGLSNGVKFSSLAPNTIKKAANIYLASEAPDGDGFGYMCRLRTDLYSKLKNKKESRTVNGKKKRAKTVLKKEKNKRAEADVLNAVLTKAYSELLNSISRIACDEETTGKTKYRLENLLRVHADMYEQILLPDPSQEKAGLSVIKGGKA